MKQEGDTVKAGEVMFEVETDKATLGFEVQDQVVLARILQQAGATALPVGHPVAVLVENQADVQSFAGISLEEILGKTEQTEQTEPTEQTEQTKLTKLTEQTTQTEPTKQQTPALQGTRQFISPLARKMLQEQGIDSATVEGTGPNGRIVKEDVLRAIQAPKRTAAPARPHKDIPHSGIRRVTASRLTESKTTIPHYYLSSEISMSRLSSFRSSLNSISETKISLSDVIVKAVALTCLRVPQANATWTAAYTRVFHYVDLSFAVQTDRGLFTPIIKDAHLLRIGEIAVKTKRLTQAAKDSTLQPEEFQGGTFTISNLGMLGVSQFSAVINPPQACILAIGTTEMKVVKEGEGFRESPVMQVTLSCDHRVVDGAVGAQWLQVFKGYMEDPLSMIL